MEEPLTYAIDTLRNEYYRIALDVRHVPTEQWGYGFSDDRQREQQGQIVEALLQLHADITSDMQRLKRIRDDRAAHEA